MALTAKIRGTFLDASGAPRTSVNINFEPIGAPYLSNGDVVTSQVITVVTNASGYIGNYGNGGDSDVVLVEGTYRVVVSDLDAFEILVPGDDTLHEIEDLVTAILNPTTSGGGGTTGPTPVSQQLASSESVFQSQIGDKYQTRKRIVLFGEGPVDPDNDLFYQLILAMNPTEIVALGNLNTGGASGTIDLAIGKPFHDWIYPYSGAYGSASPDSVNHFWYALGSEDWVPTNVTAVTDFFGFPNNERYYKASLSGGNVAIFVIDSNVSEPDGNGVASTQALWLQAQLQSATEKVRLVVFRDSPFASKSGYSFAAMDWPFAQWGATAVIAAGVKFNERITLDGNIPLFVAGGAFEQSSADTIGSPVTGSQYRNNTYPAFLVLDINEYSIKSYFVNTVGSVLDELETTLSTGYKTKHALITKPNSGLLHSLQGVEVDFGSADGQVIGGTSNFILMNEGRLVRTNSMPSVSETKANPWLKNCMILLGDDPPLGVYYWNRAYDDWSLFIGPSFVTSYFSGAKPVLDPPTFSPASGQAVGTSIIHADSAAKFQVSVDGSPFVEIDPTISNKVFFGDTEGPHWVAAYATRSGYEDSSISIGQFNA